MPTSSPRRAILIAFAMLMAITALGPRAGVGAQPQPAPTIDPDSGLAAYQFVWLLDRINTAGGAISADDVQAHFTERFVTSVGTDAIIAEIRQVATTYAPFTLVSVIRETEDLVHVQARAKDGTLVVIAVSIEHSDEKIAGFIFQPGEADLPFASPIASPIASPVASPEASPTTSPQAG